MRKSRLVDLGERVVDNFLKLFIYFLDHELVKTTEFLNFVWLYCTNLLAIKNKDNLFLSLPSPLVI